MDVVQSLFSSPTYQSTKAMLDVAAARHQAIAANLANTNTPNYKRIDLDPDFERELRDRIRSGSITPTTPIQPAIAQDREAINVRADGNNVQLDRELAALGSNSMNYAALTQFVSGSLRQLKMAIIGRSQ